MFKKFCLLVGFMLFISFPNTAHASTEPRDLLSVSLIYKEAAFTIESAQVYQGYEPQQSEFAKYYWIVGKDKSGNELIKKAFSVDVSISSLPPLSGISEEPSPEKILDEVGISVVILWSDLYEKIEVQNREGTVLASLNSTEFIKENTAQKFSERISRGIQTTLEDPQITLEPEEVLDITFIGDDYTTAELSQFHNDVTRFSNHLLTFTPFTQYTNSIAFHTVDNTVDLGCVYSGRTIVCNPLLVYGAVQLAGVPYDRVVVIVNNPEYGGAALGELAAVYNGEFGAQGFVHELGHTLSNLADEYLANVPSESTETNCYNGVPPNPAWTGIPNVTYQLECNFAEYYRPSLDSIMRTIETPSFNTVSQHYLKQSLDYYTGGATSTPTPSSSISISPTPIIKAGDANNDNKVDGVDFSIWLAHYSQNTGNGRIDGDFNNDGKVDGVDFAIWLNNYNR